MALISFSNLIFSNNTFALYTPTLSASVDNSAVSVNGSQVIKSVSQTSELPVRVTVNTNNKTGYTATLNTETDETALVNAGSVSGAKIDSIDTNKTLANFSENTWGFLNPSIGSYQPIPSLSNSANLFSTTAKTSGNESFDFKIGMKLADNLESGIYTNKLVISIVSNPYERRAVMERGGEFSGSIDRMGLSDSFEDAFGKKEKIKHVYASSVTSELIPANAKNVEDKNESDYEIKVWYDSGSQTLYYWTDANKIYLNKDSSHMFRKFTQTIDIDLSHFDFSEVIDASRFFVDMRSLESLDLGNINTQNVTNMDHMFSGLLKLTSLDLSSLDTKNVTNMRWIFSGDEKLQSLNLQNFDTGNVVDMSHMFHGVSQLNVLNLSNFHTQNVKNMSFMFHGMGNLSTLNLSNFNTSQVTDMDYMFSHASKLASLNLSSFNTSKVTNMSNMFSCMYSLTNLNLSNFNTSKVTDMNHMFSEASKLISLDLSSFDTSHVTNMRDMFSYMHSLTNLNLSNFNTSQVANMSYMFCYTLSLTSLNLSNFNTSNVTDMSYMFYIMPKLTSLDLSGFDTPRVTNMARIFSNSDGYEYDDKLEKIYVNNDFDISKLTDDSGMFKNRKKLRGGAGSFLADPSTADKTWLRIDDPTNGRPGYFTRKP